MPADQGSRRQHRAMREAIVWLRQRHLTALPSVGIDAEPMWPALPPPRALIEPAETLLIALAGGLMFTLWAFPPASCPARFSRSPPPRCWGGRSGCRSRLARVCYVIVGILLGALW